MDLFDSVDWQHPKVLLDEWKSYDLENKYNDYDIKKTVYGEGTPELEDNFSKIVETEYDYNNEKFKYLKPYYDFTFYEMGLKIACLKYYYKKYF